ncbi:TonB-dependent receptor [Mucilaginibacter robiniae]|uniref:TonB-dependent receptor n=1 Tax=Mucilaginibacter robiniae TaxID=2728022 RepID=A0A7L5E5P8_9SPHI|nr:outer membrane beta-barrel family protein [Mucilaginibacter robiniae]QJD97094.1 TonB-dependent receptor [Mucilaginibacter robiniae]
MKNLLWAVLLFLGLSSFVHAQTTLKIKGVVIDSAKNEPLSYGTVALKNAKTGLPVKSVLTQADGTFELANIKSQSLQLALISVGYQTKTITLTDTTSAVIDLGKLLLSGATHALKEVAVTATKPLMKQEVDRMSYDVQADPEAKSLTALDMMRKVPLLSVDGNNNIKLRGNDSYKILVNGKESALMARSPSDILKAMPATNIERIEVITTPPARYDAEGLAGIINIITKKNGDQGYNGNISARYNSVYGPGINLNATAKQGKFGVNGYIGYNRRNTLSTGFENSSVFNSPASSLLQNGTRANGGNNTYGTAELSYEIDSLNLLTGSFSNYYGNYTQDMSQQTLLLTGNNLVNQSYMQNNNGDNDYSGLDASINYQLGFKRSKQQLLTFSYKYSNSKNKQFTDVMFDDRNNYNQSNYQQHNNSGNREHTLQLDYAHPVKKLSIEAGGKAILRNNFSSFYNDVYSNNAQTYITDPTQTNDFKYIQDVISVYNTYQLKLEKWAFKGGLRLEHTYTDADFTSTATKINQNYNNLVPSLSVQRSFKTSSFTFGFSQRIQRPGIWQLNPFVDRSNPKYLNQGNPNLRPATTNNFELGYSNFAKGSLNISTNYSFSKNSAQSVTTFNPIDTVTTTTYLNAGSRRAWGLDVSFNYPITQKLSVNANVEALRVWIRGTYNGDFVANHGYQGYGSAYASYKFSNGYRLNINTGYYSRFVLLQGVDNYYFSTGASASKDFWKNKATINLAVGNPFKKYNKNDYITRTNDFYTTSKNYNYYRNISVNFTYKFGKLNGNIKRNEKSIQNDDVSGGGNSH